MNFLFILIAVVLLALAVVIILSQLHRKKNLPTELFAQALKSENSGEFENAVLTYETALIEVKKLRFHKELQNKIIEKLKLLRLVIAYENNAHHNYKPPTETK